MGCIASACGKESLDVADLQTGKTAFSERTASRHDLFMQPVVIATRDDDSGMRHDRRGLQKMIWHETGRDPVQPFPSCGGPHFSA
jgi:hypothetical protein